MKTIRELYRIGTGPSSSHTMGPRKAAEQFLARHPEAASFEVTLQAVTYFIDDAILVGVSRVRILHGTGSGILRTLIRQYLSTVPGVADFRDEHVQFGGAGITVVDLK